MSIPLHLRRSVHGRILCAVITGIAITGCGMDSTGDAAMQVSTGSDLLRSGESPMIADSVAGDVMLAGSSVSFSGVAGGDVISAGGDVDIRGIVGGSIRAAGGDITVDASVARNATIAGGTINLNSTSSIVGNAYLGGGTVVMDGTIGGAALVGAGEATINGSVGGDMRIEAGRITIGPRARIEGNLVYRAPSDAVTIDPAAQIGGITTVLPQREKADSGFPALFQILWMLGFLVAGAAAILLFPRTAYSASRLVGERTGGSAGLGILLIVLTPVVVLLMMITVIGIPLAVISFLLYAMLLYLTASIFALWLGGRILKNGNVVTRGSLLAAYSVGALILAVASFIPIVGALVLIAATILGGGALALAVGPALRRGAADLPSVHPPATSG